MKNRTTSQTTGPDKNRKKVNPNYDALLGPVFNATGINYIDKYDAKVQKFNPGLRSNKQNFEDFKFNMENSKKVKEFNPGLLNSPIPKNRQLRTVIPPKKEGTMQDGIQDYNSIPFKNKAIDVLKRRRYDISSEFDGQEVQGTMTERPTVGGGMVETERYNMPGGGSRMERTRYNKEGQPVKRVVRDNKINPR